MKKGVTIPWHKHAGADDSMPDAIRRAWFDAKMLAGWTEAVYFFLLFIAV